MSEKRFIITNDFKLYCDDGIFVADLNLKIGQSVLINLLNNYEIENNQLTQKIKALVQLSFFSLHFSPIRIGHT